LRFHLFTSVPDAYNEEYKSYITDKYWYMFFTIASANLVLHPLFHIPALHFHDNLEGTFSIRLASALLSLVLMFLAVTSKFCKRHVMILHAMNYHGILLATFLVALKAGNHSIFVTFPIIIFMLGPSIFFGTKEFIATQAMGLLTHVFLLVANGLYSSSHGYAMSISYTIFVLLALIVMSLREKLIVQAFVATKEAELANEKLSIALSAAEDLAITDTLTGISNRRGFEINAESVIFSSRRYGFKSSLCMIDLDFFKNINDTYGHLAGDEILKRTAQVIDKESRECDFVARLGGEEFVILFPGTDIEQAIFVAQRIKDIFEKQIITFEGQTIQCTMSMGLSEFGEEIVSIEEVIAKADEQLYEAKKSGRNLIRPNLGTVKD